MSVTSSRRALLRGVAPVLDHARFGEAPALVADGAVLSHGALAARVADRARTWGPARRLVLVEGANDLDSLVAYLRANAQKPLDPKKLPEVNAPSGEPFRVACSQCHVLPDPQRHTAKEWRAVVARMEKNMEWMNRVVGSHPARGEPQLRVEDINAFLARYSRKSL